MILILALAPAMARAQTAAGSNMPPGFYPAPTCIKPDMKRIGGTPGVRDQNAVDSYNFKVKSFNDKAAAFNACIRAYVDNAQNDINTIQAITHAAVADANTH